MGKAGRRWRCVMHLSPEFFKRCLSIKLFSNCWLLFLRNILLSIRVVIFSGLQGKLIQNSFSGTLLCVILFIARMPKSGIPVSFLDVQTTNLFRAVLSCWLRITAYYLLNVIRLENHGVLSCIGKMIGQEMLKMLLLAIFINQQNAFIRAKFY